MAGLLSLIGSGYAVFPRHIDLRAFDPTAMAHSETTMWRHYYERRYLSLFADLYDKSRAQYGFCFSPWNSVRIAAAAARAARAFQPSTSRSGAQAALPFLEEYFGLLARATPVPLDIKAAARAELERLPNDPSKPSGPTSANSSVTSRRMNVKITSERQDTNQPDRITLYQRRPAPAACRRNRRARTDIPPSRRRRPRAAPRSACGA